jgi:hypothetical protein
MFAFKEQIMLILNPWRVYWGETEFEQVRSVHVDRMAAKAVAEWSDAGPFAVFADVPEQRIEVTIVQDLTGETLSSPVPGEQQTLEFFTSPGGDVDRRRVRVQCVVMSVKYELSEKPLARRTIVLFALAPETFLAADPLEIAAA